jgi:hypothetical protein
MRRYNKHAYLLLLSLTMAMAIVGANLEGQNKEASDIERDETITPIVDSTAQVPADPKEKAIRLTRNKRHDYKGNPADAPRFILGEKSPPIALELPVSDGPALHSIPVQESDAVVIGEVTDTHAYLSNDKTKVYSEFTLRLEDVLKDGTASLYSGATITAERLGGTVKLDSGKTLVRGALGRTMPRLGRRYVLFLNYSDVGQTFPIITGYELRNGKVIPLDGMSSKTPQLASFAAHKGVDEMSFINQVRQALREGSNR